MKKGFTLAEILLVLLIIGVISSLLIPSIIANVQKNQQVAGLKRIYNSLSSATKLIESDNGGTIAGSFAGNTTDDFMNAYAAKLNASKICLANQNPGECWHDGNTTWHILQGTDGWGNFTTSARLVLQDGTMLSFNSRDLINCSNSNYVNNGNNENCGMIFADINGFNQPNILGRDIFVFEVNKYGLYPRGNKGSMGNIAVWSQSCSTSSTWIYNGSGCAARIMAESDMIY